VNEGGFDPGIDDTFKLSLDKVGTLDEFTGEGVS